MAVAKKVKSKKPDLSPADIAVLNREIEAHLVEWDRLEQELNARKQQLDEKYGPMREVQMAAAKRAANQIRDWAARNRSTILEGKKTLYKLPEAGSLQWYMPQPALVIRSAKELIKEIERRNDKDKYLSYKPQINKDALKAAPQVLVELRGVHLGQQEKFVMRFANSPLRLERPSKGYGNWKVVRPEEKK